MDFAYCSENVRELSKALIEVQKVLNPAHKDSENPYVKSRYASINSVMSACKSALLANGILLTQYPVPVEGENLGLVTKLIHAESGQFQASLAVIPLSKHDPQAMGSAITYGRRYSLSAMLGIVTEEDDDGNAATYAAGNRNLQQQNVKSYPSRQENPVGKKTNESSRTPLTTYMEKLGLQDLIQCYMKYLSAKYKCTVDRLTNEQYQEQRATLEKCQSDALTMRNFMRTLHSYM